MFDISKNAKQQEAKKMAKDKESMETQVAQTPVKYHKVVFGQRHSGSDFEPEQLSFSHNGGVPIQIVRGVEVIVPDYILRLADDAKMMYQNEDGSSYTVSQRVHYTVRGDSTEAEYVSMKREGTAATKRAIEDKLKHASR